MSPGGRTIDPDHVADDVRHQGPLHDERRSRRLSLLVLGYVFLAYWLTGWVLNDRLGSTPDLNFYVIQPLLWSGLALLAYLGWRRLPERPAFSSTLTTIAGVVAIFQIAVLVMAGLITSFGDSATAGRLVNYPKNVLYFTTLLLGAETARAYLYHVWKNWNQPLAFGGAVAVFWVVAIPAAQWTAIDNLERVLEVVAALWIPALAVSALATWLTSFGGLGPGFSYRWALLAFIWLTPRVPNLPWYLAFLIGLITPIASAWLIRAIYAETAEGQMRRWFLEPQPGAADDDDDGESEAGRRWLNWVVTGSLGGMLVLFFAGFFGVTPITVEGNSMEPAYERGDIAIVRPGFDPNTLKLHDVVMFSSGGMTVIHRIVDIESTPDGLVFTTRGDSVDIADPPVRAAQIEGKVVFLLPEIGRVGIWLRNLF